MMNKVLTLIFALSIMALTACPSRAQDTLTLQNAIEIALENNYSIHIAENDFKTAVITNTPGKAGMMPRLTASASNTNQFYNTYQKYAAAQALNASDAHNTISSATLQLDWTLFDGMAMFVNKSRLNELEKLGKIKAAETIERTLSEITNTYYLIASLEHSIMTMKENIIFSIDRKEIAVKKGEFGAGSRINVLQAITDLNADSSQLIRLENNRDKAKISLNTTLGRPALTQFSITSDIDIRNDLNYDSLVNMAIERNKALKIAKIENTLSGLALEQAKSKLYPSLNLSSGFYFSKTDYGSGSTLENRTYGPAVALTAQYSVFDGFNIKTSIQAAEIEVKSSEEYEDMTRASLMNALHSLIDEHSTSKRLIEFEESNLAISKENFSLAMEKYRVGAISDLELRDIQTKLFDAQNRVTSARFDTKITETELLRLAGELRK